VITKPANHPAIPVRKIGVLLVNLGTPDAPTPAAVRRYLKQFLSDRRVVEISPFLWQPILRGIILNTRPRKSAHAYQQVWTPEGSPLAVITAAQAAGLRKQLAGVQVDWAMRYGNPAIADTLSAMRQDGCDRILIAPLYPQYSGATTGSTIDEVSATLATMRWQPAIRTLPAYHDGAAYIGAVKTSVDTQLAALDFVPDAVMASFHSMPQRTLSLGDPYHCQCVKTARLLGEALGRELNVSFQSRLGRAKWLEPATDATLASLPGKGVTKLAVITPGFSADNLETLEEIAIRGKETFLEGGGEQFAMLSCLNASAPGMDMLEGIIRRELAGWL
jgi:ferrochelatase